MSFILDPPHSPSSVTPPSGGGVRRLEEEDLYYQSILYLFQLNNDIKVADINFQGQRLALMDPIKVITDDSCT